MTTMTATPATLGVANVLRSEWTKLRSLRSTYWTAIAGVLAAVVIATLECVSFVQHFTPNDLVGFDAAWFSVQGLYALSYPTGWVVQTQRNAPPQSYFALLSSGGDASVNVEAQQISPAPSDLAALDEQAISTLAQPGTSPGNFSGATTVTIGGQAWTRVTGDAQLIVHSGQPPTYGHVAALSTQRGPYTYTILCVSTASSADAARAAFTTDDANAFQPLLASFTFQSQG